MALKVSSSQRTPKQASRSDATGDEQTSCRSAWARSGNTAWSIKASTVARSDAGIDNPSSFAVLRLIISSNFTGCWTGKSETFALSKCDRRMTPRAGTGQHGRFRRRSDRQPRQTGKGDKPSEREIAPPGPGCAPGSKRSKRSHHNKGASTFGYRRERAINFGRVANWTDRRLHTQNCGGSLH